MLSCDYDADVAGGKLVIGRSDIEFLMVRSPVPAAQPPWACLISRGA